MIYRVSEIRASIIAQKTNDIMLTKDLLKNVPHIHPLNSGGIGNNSANIVVHIRTG